MNTVVFLALPLSFKIQDIEKNLTSPDALKVPGEAVFFC